MSWIPAAERARGNCVALFPSSVLTDYEKFWAIKIGLKIFVHILTLATDKIEKLDTRACRAYRRAEVIAFAPPYVECLRKSSHNDYKAFRIHDMIQ
jgi:hypothetical protein